MKRRNDPLFSLGLAPSASQSRLTIEQDSGIATEGESDADQCFLRPDSHFGTYLFSDDDDPGHNDTQRKEPASQSIHQVLRSSVYHANQADQAIHTMKQLMQEDDWKKVLKHKSGVTVYMMQPRLAKGSEKVAIFRGESVIQNFSPQAIFYVVGMRKLWDENFEEGRLVENLNETTSLTYESYRANSGTKNRDVSLVEKIECSSDGVIIFVCTSVDTPSIPKVPGRTRDQIKLQGWVLKPLQTSPPSTKVTYITQESVKGWIPGLTKKSLARRPLVIAAINTYLQQKADRLRATAALNPPKQPHLSAINPPLVSLSSSTTSQRRSIYAQRAPQGATLGQAKQGILAQPPPRKSSLQPPTKETTNRQVKFANDIPTRSTSPYSRTSSVTNGSTTQSSRMSDERSSTSTSDTQWSTDQRSSQDTFQTTNDKRLPEPLPSTFHNPALKLYPSSRHRSTRRQCMDLLKQLASDDLDDWKPSGEKNNVQLYTKSVQGSPLPIMRGETTLSGPWTAEQVCSVIQCFGARSLWDDYFESGVFVERFSQKEYLSHVKLRTVFPIQSRDFSLLTVLESDAATGTIHVASASVADGLVPENKTSIRAKMILYGWILAPKRSSKGKIVGIKTKFVCQMDMAGQTPLPPAIVRQLTSQVPACVDRMQDYLDKHGCPPYIRRVAGKIVYEDFDVKAKTYHIGYIAKCTPSRQHKSNTALWCTDIRTHQSLYSQGFSVFSRPTSQVRIELRPDAMGICVYTEGDGLDGQTIEIILIPSEQVPKGEIRYSCNGECIRTITKANDTIRPPLTLEIPPLLFPQKPLVQQPLKVPIWNGPSSEPLDTSKRVEEPVRRNSYVIILGDDLSFTGPQLSIIVLLMAVCYYMGKFSCRC
ncbi:hypothetical protein CLU79DRAFT_553377 [Phycomyces nitens]|nr:hypothetical protein CLU79DRAFT_553377 [Phycomyces nitens]